MVRLAVIYALVFASGIISGGVVAFVILGADNADSNVELLFVQSSTSGTFDDGEQILTLVGISPTTVYFSDRPNRITGAEDTKLFIGMWSDGADSFASDPPNAVLEIRDGNEESDVFIIELMNPIYDPKSKTLQYTVKILAEASDGLTHYNDRNDSEIPATFEGAVLFIDGLNFLTWHKAVMPSISLSATQSGGNIILSWNDPNNNGLYVIPDYKIKYRPLHTSSWITFEDGINTDTTTTVTGLATGQSYQFAVSAINSIGYHLGSNVVTVTLTG